MDMWQRVKVAEAASAKPQANTTKPPSASGQKSLTYPGAKPTQGPVAAPGQQSISLQPPSSAISTAPAANPVGNAVAQVGNVLPGIAKGVVDIGAGVASSFLDSVAAGTNQNRVMSGQLGNIGSQLNPNVAKSIDTRNATQAEKASNASQAVLNWGQSATSAIDKVAQSVIPAPTTVAGEIIGKGADVVGRAIPNVVGAALVGPAAAGAIGSAQVYGNERIGGATPDQALGPAVAAGVAEGIGAKVFNEGGVLGKVLGESKLGARVTDAIGEGLEENIESILQGQKPNAAEFGYGAVAGAVLGPLAGAVQGEVNKAQQTGEIKSWVSEALKGGAEVEVFSGIPGTRGYTIGGSEMDTRSPPTSPSTGNDTNPNGDRPSPVVPGGGSESVIRPETSPTAPVETPNTQTSDPSLDSGGMDSSTSSSAESSVRTAVVDLPVITLPEGGLTLDELIGAEIPTVTLPKGGPSLDELIETPAEVDTNQSVGTETVQSVAESLDSNPNPSVEVQTRTLPGAPTPTPTVEPQVTPFTQPQVVPNPNPTVTERPATEEVPVPTPSGISSTQGAKVPSTVGAVKPNPWVLPKDSAQASGENAPPRISNSVITNSNSEWGVQSETKTDSKKAVRPGDSTIYRGLGSTGQVYSTESYNRTFGGLRSG